MSSGQAAVAREGAPAGDAVAAVDERVLAVARPRTPASGRGRGWLVRRALAAADVVALSLAFLLAEAAFGGGGTSDRLRLAGEGLVFAATLPGWVIVAKLHGLYDRDEERADHSTVDELVGVFHLVTIGAWLLVTGGWLLGVLEPDLQKLVAFWVLAIVLITLVRTATRAFCRRLPIYRQRAIVVGAGEIGQLLARKFQRHPEYGIDLVGFVDETPGPRDPELEQVPLLGPPERLPALIRELDVERVVVAFSMDADARHLELIRSLRDLDVQVDVVPRLFELVSPSVPIHTVEGFPLMALLPPRLSRSSLVLKRAMDVALSALLLVVFAPVFVLLAMLVKCDSRGPVFFRQLRMGHGGRAFRIYKFRTMVRDAEARKSGLAHLNKHAHEGGDPRMFKIAEDPRVTRVGRLLRRFSLDELPQLLNVLKGEMTLVGPRPLVLEEDRHVAGWARRRLDLKPGMTGLWQVLGRNEIPFGEMLNLDYLYVTTWSPGKDLRLLLHTFPLMLRGSRAVY